MSVRTPCQRGRLGPAHSEQDRAWLRLQRARRHGIAAYRSGWPRAPDPNLSGAEQAAWLGGWDFEDGFRLPVGVREDPEKCCGPS